MMDLLVMIQIDGRQCAFRAIDVQSVMEIEAITCVPRTHPHILGLSTRRSQTLTVIDCRQALGLSPHEDPTGERAAVVQHAGYTYALLVDRIEDVEVATSDIQPLSDAFGPEWAEKSLGMVETARGATLLLDLASLVEGPQASARAA